VLVAAEVSPELEVLVARQAFEPTDSVKVFCDVSE
jgi:hypothetical protein